MYIQTKRKIVLKMLHIFKIRVGKTKTSQYFLFFDDVVDLRKITFHLVSVVPWDQYLVGVCGGGGGGVRIPLPGVWWVFPGNLF